MKIACEACGAKYTIADDKIRGRKVKIRCKGCGTPIVVDGQQQGEGASVADPEAETDAALEPADAVTWSVNLSETDSRTMSSEEIVEAYASGVVTSDAFVWKDGMADWVPLLQSELAPLLPSAPKPAASSPVAAKSSPFATGTPLPGAARGGALFGGPAQAARPAAARAVQLDNPHDLFGAVDSAGSEEDVATSAPIIPHVGAPAHDDGKLTGARNENSVLFSLDALKAGFSPTATPAASKPVPKAPGSKAPGGARPQQPSNPDDPFGMGAGGLMGTSGALFGADNQALLTAPAPPPPPPPPTAAQIAAGAAPVAAPNNKLVYIVGGVGGVIIIGLLLALLTGKKPDTVPSAENSASPSASAPVLSAAEKPAEEAKPAESAKPSEAPSASASASASPAASASAGASAAATTKPGAVASPNTAPKKPKEEAAAPAGDAPPFSKASAISALGAAASGAGGCKKPGGPTGPGKATVTFAPSGRVTTATVAGGSYSGTAVGGCVASLFRRARVPPFSGSSVTVSKSFQIN